MRDSQEVLESCQQDLGGAWGCFRDAIAIAIAIALALARNSLHAEVEPILAVPEAFPQEVASG